MIASNVISTFIGDKGRPYYSVHSGFHKEKINKTEIFFDVNFPLDVALELEKKIPLRKYGPMFCVDCRDKWSIRDITLLLCNKCINDLSPKYGCKCDYVSFPYKKSCGYLCRLYSSVCGLYSDVDIETIMLQKLHYKEKDNEKRMRETLKKTTSELFSDSETESSDSGNETGSSSELETENNNATEPDYTNMPELVSDDEDEDEDEDENSRLSPTTIYPSVFSHGTIRLDSRRRSNRRSSHLLDIQYERQVLESLSRLLNTYTASGEYVSHILDNQGDGPIEENISHNV